MAENIVDGGLFKFVFRHGTPEEWEQSVSVLAEGEIGLAIDPGDPTRTVARAGDGLRSWADLPDVAGNLEGILDQAKAHADGAVGSTLTTAKTHADALDATNRSAWAAADAGIRKDFAAADAGRLIEAKQHADRGDVTVLASAQSHANTAAAGAVSTANTYTETYVQQTVIGVGIPTVVYVGDGAYEITGATVVHLGDGIYEIGE